MLAFSERARCDCHDVCLCLLLRTQLAARLLLLLSELVRQLLHRLPQLNATVTLARKLLYLLLQRCSALVHVCPCTNELFFFPREALLHRVP